jgi:putative transposase
MQDKDSGQHRRSIRLPYYDYSLSGAYFITICTHKHVCVLGEIVSEHVRLDLPGEIVLDCWNNLPGHYPTITLDSIIIMPNHVHGIIWLTGNGARADLKSAPTGCTLSEVVRSFKSFSTRRINEFHFTPGSPLWQRNYYEHIIRNERQLTRA